MKELTAPTSPNKNSSFNNRKGNQRSGNRTSPQKDRSPRKEKSKSFNNAPSTKSTAHFANFQQPSQKLSDINLESTTSFPYSSSTVDDAMFPYDEEILLTPDNILTMKPASPTKDSKVYSSPVKQAPLVSEKSTLSSEAVDILELLTRKDNVVRLGQAAKKVAEAQMLSSAPIEIPEKKKATSSPVPSPSTTIFRSPSPPTRDTNASIPTSSERFAGPGFCNSPAPQNLPIPAFVDMPVQQPSSASRKSKSQSLNIHSNTKGVKPTRLNFSPKKEQPHPIAELQSPRPTHITQHDVTKLLQTAEQAYAVPAPVNNYLDQLSHQLQSMLNIPVQS